MIRQALMQYIVGEAEEDQMFYYFIKSKINPEEDPLLVWLNGGLGYSSFSGLVYENGPLAFKVETYNGSIPVGDGFSYSRNPLADIPSDTGSAKRVDEFRRKIKRKLKLFVKAICLYA